MMIKQIKYFWMIALFLPAILLVNPAYALSLGEITVKSHFAEPFLAEISLPSYTEDEIENLDIHLATENQHTELGYDFVRISRSFKFFVKENKKGKLVIEIRSKKAVKELSLSFLIEIYSINGRIIKGFDILLTPKAISDAWEKEAEQIAIINSPVTDPALSALDSKDNKKGTRPPVTKSKTPKFTKTTIVESSENSNPAKQSGKPFKSRPKSKIRKLENGGIEYVNVGNGESLSRIAQNIRPEKNMSMHQVMVALFEENRDAFINNNINGLKSGVTLKLENLDNITKISRNQAIARFRDYSQPAAQKKTRPIAPIAEKPSELKVAEAPKPTFARLQISSETDVLPQSVLEEISKEQLAAAQAALEDTKFRAKTLSSENEILKQRILELEHQLDQAAESLFLNSLKGDEEAPEGISQPKKSENLLIVNADLQKEVEKPMSMMQYMKLYQTPILIISAILLISILLGIRNREKILDIIHNFKHGKARRLEE